MEPLLYQGARPEDMVPLDLCHKFDINCYKNELNLLLQIFYKIVSASSEKLLHSSRSLPSWLLLLGLALGFHLIFLYETTKIRQD